MKSVNFWLNFVVSFLHQMVPLHIAAEKGRYRIVGCLVECEEADINIQDDKNVGIYTFDKRVCQPSSSEACGNQSKWYRRVYSYVALMSC